MASNRIDELMRNASAKDREQLQDQVERLKGINYQVDRTSHIETPPEGGSKPEQPPVTAPGPTHSETTPAQSQRGAEKIRQSMPSNAKARSVEQGHTLDKAGADRQIGPER